MVVRGSLLTDKLTDKKRVPRRRRSVSPPTAARLDAPGRQGAAVVPVPVAQALRYIAQACVVLLLLTPLVVTPDTVYLYVVGKALYWRVLVEVTFAVWVVLALCVPAYRPPRSWLLGLLGVGVACSLLTAYLGVSPERSFWSTYERMLGVVNELHALAFAIVVVSLFRAASRTGQALLALLNFNLGVSALVALLAVGRFLELDMPFFGSLPELHLPGLGGVLGNPTWLAALVVVNGTLALGFLVRSFLTDAASPGRHGARLFWLATAALNYVALYLTSSRGALMGLVGGLAFLLFGGLSAFTRIRLRSLVLGFVGAAAMAIVAFLALPRFIDPHASSRLTEDGTVPGPIVGTYFPDRSARSRLAVWQAGLEGFAERPLLGWGPENFTVVFGRFQPGTVSHLRVHDRAHNTLIDQAATRGLLGVASYLGLWLFAFYVVLRAAKRLPRAERALALFAGAALMCSFVQGLTLFDTVATNLQCLLLICYLAWIEVEMRSAGGRRWRLTAVAERWYASMAERMRRALGKRAASISTTLRLAVVGATMALLATGLWVNQRIWSGASTLGRGSAVDIIEEAIAAFEPMAREPRFSYFAEVHRRWPTLRVRDPAEARRVLGVLDAEAKAAVAAEPENWLVHYFLAWAYRNVASSDPEYQARADDHIRRLYDLAPRHNMLRTGAGVLPRPNEGA